MSSEREVLDGEDSRPSRRGTAQSGSGVGSLIWLGVVIVVILAALGAIAAGMASALHASQSSRAESGDFWAAFTGPVGDTLGPVLSTLAILVTVFVAVVWQPQRQHIEQEQRRAAQIDGWLAESADGSRLGVVVSNEADAVALDLDLVISQERDGTLVRVGLDREFKVPRGTWFIEFLRADAHALQWRAPVPVRESDGIEVVLDPLAQAKVTVAGRHVLRPHVRQTSGSVVHPYFILSEMRYVLHDVAWMRDTGGRAVKARPLSENERLRREAAGEVLRQEQRDRAASSARVHPDVETLVRHTIEVLCRAGSPLTEDLYAAAIGADLPVDAHILPGVRSLRRPTRDGKLVLTLDNPNGSVLTLEPSNDSFPHKVYLRDQSTDGRFVIGTKNADGEIVVAGARSVGLDRGFQFRDRTASSWMGSDAQKWVWISALRAMVLEAGSASPRVVEEQTSSTHPADG